MSLVGILDSIGDEVGEQLLDSSLVEVGEIGVVRIILDEGDAWFLYTLFKSLTHVIEDLGDVHLLREDGEGLAHARGFEDIIDEAHEHVAVAADDMDKLQALLISLDHRQEV